MPPVITVEDLLRLSEENAERDPEAFWENQRVDLDGIMELAEKYAASSIRLVITDFLNGEYPENYLEAALCAMFEIGWEAHRQYVTNAEA